MNSAGDLSFVRVALAGNRKSAERDVDLIRDRIFPDPCSGRRAQPYVTGITAGGMDFSDGMYRAAPFVFVLGLAFLLLVMFRSIVIPVKAILLNLIFVAAAFGVVGIIFRGAREWACWSPRPQE